MCVALLALWTVYCLYGVVVLAVKHDRGLGFADLALIWLVASALLGGVAGVAYAIHRSLARAWERAARE